MKFKLFLLINLFLITLSQNIGIYNHVDGKDSFSYINTDPYANNNIRVQNRIIVNGMDYSTYYPPSYYHQYYPYRYQPYRTSSKDDEFINKGSDSNQRAFNQGNNLKLEELSLTDQIGNEVKDTVPAFTGPLPIPSLSDIKLGFKPKPKPKPKPITKPKPNNSTALNADEMLKLVNEVRKKVGSRPLKYNDKLIKAASEHSIDQAKHKKMSHEGSDGSTPSQRVSKVGYDWIAVAENVAWNQKTVKQVMDAWINSPGHYKNLINKQYCDFGASEVNFYWTQVFGATENCK